MREQGGAFHLLAKEGAATSRSTASRSASTARARPGGRTASLVYTDRSIYRPGQKLYWKVLAYDGSPEDARFRAAAQTPVTVWLVDPNGEKVETRTVTTNGFGTAAGEIVVPTGRLLGSWRVESSLSGNAAVRVEEYKRPTFEATFQDPKEPMRLNRKAVLTGEAKYYFGLPVASGAVKWRVARETRPPVVVVVLGLGLAVEAPGRRVGRDDARRGRDLHRRLHARGRRDRPRREARSTWRYVVDADVVDEGGETRSATRSVRLGFVSVEASLAFPTGFVRARGAGFRLDHEDEPRRRAAARHGDVAARRARAAGQDAAPGRPSAPRGRSGGRGRCARGGVVLDGRRRAAAPLGHVVPRGGRPARPSRRRREGARRGRARRTTAWRRSTSGSSTPGAWRVRYATVDDFGAKYETFRDFLVAGGKEAPRLPLALLVESGSVRVGETARLLAASGLPGPGDAPRALPGREAPLADGPEGGRGKDRHRDPRRRRRTAAASASRSRPCATTSG